MSRFSIVGTTLIFITLCAQYARYIDTGCSQHVNAIERDFALLEAKVPGAGSVPEKTLCTFYRQGIERMHDNIHRWQQCEQTRSSIKISLARQTRSAISLRPSLRLFG